MYNEIIFTETIKQYYYYFSVGTFNILIKRSNHRVFFGDRKILGKKLFIFFSFLKNPSPSEATHIDLCLTWVDGYGGRAGGLHWFDLGGNGGAVFGGIRVEFLPRVEALNVLLLEAVFLWKHFVDIGFGAVVVVVISGSGSGSNGSANSLSSSLIVE